MKVRMLIVLALFVYAGTSSAQTKQGSAMPIPKAEKPSPVEKPKKDIDSFFKDAEKQTRKAQENGGANCVPKPKNEAPIEPVS